jgi:hypothetical protein
MGVEYRIVWKPGNLESAKAWLQRRGGRSVVFEGKESFEFRFSNSQSDSVMPDISVTLEEEGVYLCDYSRSDKSAAIMRGLIDEALTESGLSDSVLVQSL